MTARIPVVPRLGLQNCDAKDSVLALLTGQHSGNSTVRSPGTGQASPAGDFANEIAQDTAHVVLLGILRFPSQSGARLPGRKSCIFSVWRRLPVRLRHSISNLQQSIGQNFLHPSISAQALAVNEMKSLDAPK